MPAVSSIFLVLALILAVVIGPQTRPWSWGPAMVALGVSVLAALPVIWKRGKSPADFGLLAFGVLTAAWFGWRAGSSPVAELGYADQLLLAGAVGAFVSIRAISGNAAAEKILSWGIALLLLANVVVIGQQLIDPTFTPVFRARSADKMISGFFAHYNETANYLIVSSMLVAAAALFGRHATATRIFWLLIAIAGVSGVWFTRSRGGILGAAVACGVFAVITLVIGKRRGAKWFAPALIAIPVIGLVIGTFLFMGWKEAQELRQAGTGIEDLLDNNCRLYLLGIAASCIGMHPLAGGGSRSFGWECFRFVDVTAQGAVATRSPELVHNEFVQSATDYGLVGAGLLAGLFGALALAAILRLLFEETPRDQDSRNAWRLGALAGMAGMLVQSCFSFVFHLMPGILLLGICLGQMSRPTALTANAKTTCNRIFLTLAAISCIILLFPAGWQGIRVTRILWPAYFSKHAVTSAESRIEALTDAIRIWPQFSLYQDRAAVFQTIAFSNEASSVPDAAERAIDDYHQASLRHPYHPSYVINRAILLSHMQHDAEAEEAYAKAIQLQGGMELGFRGHFLLATHLLRKGLRQLAVARPEPAHATLELAAEQIETTIREVKSQHPDVYETRLAIHESLGTACEAIGDRQGALKSYNFASALFNGPRAHYRAGMLIGKIAGEAWSNRRPSEAMKYFIDARNRVDQAGGNLPQGVTPSQRLEYISYLDESIAFLKGAKVEPMK